MSPEPHNAAERLAAVTALDMGGQPVRLGRFWNHAPAVVVFVRHFG